MRHHPLDHPFESDLPGEGPRYAAQVWVRRAERLLPTEGLGFAEGLEVQKRLDEAATTLARGPIDSEGAVRSVLDLVEAAMARLPQRFVPMLSEGVSSEFHKSPTAFEILEMAHRLLRTWSHALSLLDHRGPWGVLSNERNDYRGGGNG